VRVRCWEVEAAFGRALVCTVWSSCRVDCGSYLGIARRDLASRHQHMHPTWDWRGGREAGGMAGAGGARDPRIGCARFA